MSSENRKDHNAMEVEVNLEEELKKIEAKIKEAEETGGAQDIRDALLERAELYLKFDKIDLAIDNFNQAYKKSISISKKMDIVFSLLKIEILEKKDLQKTKEYIDQCH